LVANSWKLWLNGCMTTFIVIHNIWVLALFSNIVAFKWEFYVWKHKVYKYNLTTPNPFPNMYIYYYEQDCWSTHQCLFHVCITKQDWLITTIDQKDQVWKWNPSVIFFLPTVRTKNSVPTAKSIFNYTCTVTSTTASPA
jgi:hypothetical protein